MKWPPVTLIVLNWNAGETLSDCLRALLAQDYPDFQVVVVDNASTDDSPAHVAARFPQVILMRNDENRGFAAGNNTGLRASDAPFAVLVNPDVIVDPGWLQALIAPMIADETIGIAGCKLFFPGKEKLNHAGGFMQMPQAFPGHYGGGQPDDGAHQAQRDVAYVIGAVMALRREMLDRIGLLDEGFFLYYEDADLCVRAQRVGYRVVYLPQATAVHIESITTDRKSDFYWRWMSVSRWRYLLKHGASQQLLHESLPAEMSWLPKQGTQVRQAAAHAYRQTVLSLPAIWRDRARDGMPPLPGAEQAAVAAGLHQLRRLAWQPVTQQLTALAAQSQVRERPFRSNMPLIGSAVAACRALWNSVATKWYVRPMLEQQNRFNHQLVWRLQVQAEQLLAQEQGQADLVEDISVLTQELQEMNRLLRSIDERLAQLESARSSTDAGRHSTCAGAHHDE